MDANISLSILGIWMMGNLSSGQSVDFYLDEKKIDDVMRTEIGTTVVDEHEKKIIILVGEGGTSGNLFVKAAETYKNENGGEIYRLTDGDDFVMAVNKFIEQHGYISHLEYFGHGNRKGLYINQLPNVHGGLYVNDISLNVNYRAASIMEISGDIFDIDGTIRINGCNAANGYPEKETIAQQFANYFGVEVLAAIGPTEFSKILGPGGAVNSVYMVPTSEKLGFVNLAPQAKIKGFFADVREGQSFTESVKGLTEMGLDLNFGNLVGGGEEEGLESFERFENVKFEPYKIITYGEALNFCRIAVGDSGKCDLNGHNWDERIRNLGALKMLMDAFGVEIKRTDPWFNGYISGANQLGGGILSDDFVYKKWITRGEMAELTWGLVMVRGGSFFVE
ncbi:hypothetical protein KKG71_03890 [Patescibacteria group bacterium]|nr:hypothetical protein [Patescibacteria group bacterium]